MFKFIAEIKRNFRLWVNTFKIELNSWQLAFDQRRCPHKYRPARIENKPGRICSICEKAQPLSPEQYFAEFGEQGWNQQWY